jgi:hypothetical protein
MGTSAHRARERLLVSTSRAQRALCWLGRALGVCLASVPALSATAPQGSDLPYPETAGALNVRDFGAVGDGVHDDTAAFVAALAQSSERAEHWHVRIVQVSAGTYRVSDTISKHFADGTYNAGLVLIGAGPERTVIRLADHADGFQDPAHPKAVIFTSGKGFAQAPKDGYALRGEGNDGFSNFVENLTVDTGSGNPGAIGIDYLASNQGALRRVVVRGTGRVGISLARPWFGPGLLQGVTIDGFDIGLDVASVNYGVTIDGLRLLGQRQLGLRNVDNLVSAHNLEIHGYGTAGSRALDNASVASMMVIDGGHIAGVADVGSNHGWAYVRDLHVADSATFLGTPAGSGAPLDGVYQGTRRVSRAAPTWALHGAAEPLPPEEPGSAWVSVADFAHGATPGEASVDPTAALRAAFAAGAHTIYMPFGIYPVHGNLEIPPSVWHIVGMNSVLVCTDRAENDADKGLLRAHPAGVALLIEKLVIQCGGARVAIEHAGVGALVIRDVVAMGATLSRDANGGPLYLNNVSGGFLVRVSGRAPVFGRQVDTEGGGSRGGVVKVRITNDGAPMWLLGLKSEGDNTLVAGSNGAVTDILGALVYPLTRASAPLFSSIDSRLQATGVEIAFKPEAVYRTVLQGANGGLDISQSADGLPARPPTQGVFLPRIITSE